MDDFGGGGGDDRRGFGSRSRGGGGGGRGGGGGGGRGGSKGGAGFTQVVPKFIQQMLAANPQVRLQGQRSHAVNTNGGMSEEDLQGVLLDATTRQPVVPQEQSRNIGQDRPDREDEAPQVANLDSFEGEDLSDILPHLKKKEEDESASTTAAVATSSSSTAADGSSSSSAPSKPAALSLNDARLLGGVKRIREQDTQADQLEAATGKHIFRKAIKDESAAAAEAEANKGLSAEEIARKKKRKKEEREKSKAKLTFDEDDI